MSTGAPTIITCDSEPIHLLGAIQPTGCLLAISADWIVVRASLNVADFLGTAHRDVIGAPVQDLLSADTLHDIRGRLQQSGGAGTVEHLARHRLRPDGPDFGVALHQSGSELVLEFIAAPPGARPDADTLRGMLTRIERHRALPAIYREAARQVRAMTGFDRVLLYRFDDDGAGEVVGEALRSGLPPLLGLHYPASDIPVQARALYLRNPVRGIADIDAAPVPVVPALSPEGQPLDLSMSVLRSVSPVHVEYLRNMGVRASLSISILNGGGLWGLIACHHTAPKPIDLATQSMLELFGRLFSNMLAVRLGEAAAQYEARVREVHHQIAAAFADPTSNFATMPEFLHGIADYVPADGIGAYHQGQISLAGLTPTREEFLGLVRFLNKTAAGQVFATHYLSEVYPPAADFVARGAGILSIPISRVPRDYLVFFRREVISTVTWAGEPAKPEALGPNGIRLTPRKSFEAWRQIVQFQSERWAPRELAAAQALRVTLVEVVLRLSDLAQAERASHQHRQEVLVAELNHRVRNILGLVRGLITQSAAVAGGTADFVAALQDRIASLARAHDLLTAEHWEPVSLHALLHAEVATLGHAGQRLVLLGPDVRLAPRAFTTMALVVHELATNARKYGALTSEYGQVTLTTAFDAIGNARLEWRESGGPAVQPPARRGFGSTILEQAIPFEIHGSSMPRYLPSGFVIDIVLPATVATMAPASSPTPAPPPDTGPADAAAVPALLRACLLVEDNLFIATDVEEILLGLGAGRIAVVRSVTEAMAALAGQRFSFALLDVNLGAETSFPIAHALRAAGVPFAFGTGYGDAMAMEAALADVPVVTKPYQPAALLRALQQVLPRAAAVG